MVEGKAQVLVRGNKDSERRWCVGGMNEIVAIRKRARKGDCGVKREQRRGCDAGLSITFAMVVIFSPVLCDQSPAAYSKVTNFE